VESVVVNAVVANLFTLTRLTEMRRTGHDRSSALYARSCLAGMHRPEMPQQMDAQQKKPTLFNVGFHF